MTEVVNAKCACKDCVCVFEVSKAVQKDNKYYCSDACADNHKNQSGCNHSCCDNCKG
ncbi:metallothionein [Spartinivicinus poritis]|uniref:Metallothionein n=1 Tax=Spartinivicinus poritis TaxID=2994640 RepID=A0ABT5UI87_9GAMM|nr:metallothionein [Spartinivicinus sp. A2-2]MDE1466106.1 metallothionein [Spartinivicinus sp. A2-2]